MNEYPDNLKLRDALQIYFSKYHFPNGGYHLRWFKIKLGFLYIPLPNTKARIAAVKFHDVHHIITGYNATLQDEAEIAGWEIASGCGKYYAAWVLNFGSFFYGSFFFTSLMYRAFMRGSHSKTNFYHNAIYDDTLLDKTVDELREITGTERLSPNSFTDNLAFVGWYMLSLFTCALLFFVIYVLGKLLF